MVTDKKRKLSPALSTAFLAFVSLSVVAFSSFVGKHFLDLLVSLQGEQSQTIALSNDIQQEGDVAGTYTEVIDMQLPEGFPDSFPVYPGSGLVDFWVDEEEGLDSYSLVWETDKSFAEVSSYFKEVFNYLQWQNEIVLDAAESLTLSFADESLSGFLGVGEDKSTGKVVVSVTLGVDK